MAATSSGGFHMYVYRYVTDERTGLIVRIDEPNHIGNFTWRHGARVEELEFPHNEQDSGK